MSRAHYSTLLYSFPTLTTTLVKVKNLRTGVEGVIGWNAFRAVGARMMCGCKEAKCHCIYEDIYASLEYRERNI